MRTLLKRHYDTELLREHLDSANIKALITPSADPNISYRLKNDLNAKFHESEVLTDSEGIRVGRESRNYGDDMVKLTVVGDSTSFGWRVNFEETYAELLRAGLEESLGRETALRNLSVPGYNAAQEYYSFKENILSNRTDVLIVHHDHNDAQATGWDIRRTTLHPNTVTIFWVSAGEVCAAKGKNTTEQT